MCHIVVCISMAFDFCQRLITYTLCCIIGFLVIMLLIGASLAGLAYGYKYQQVHNVKKLQYNLRDVPLDPQMKLSEMDPSYFKSLRSYYLDSITTTTTTEKDNSTDSLRYGQELFKNVMLEDDVDRIAIDQDEMAPNRPTIPTSVEKSESAIKDYVKKLNWVVHNDDFENTTNEQELNKRGVQKNPRMRFSKKKHGKNKDFHSDLKKLTEFSGFPSRNVVPLRPMEPKSKTYRKTTDYNPTNELITSRHTMDMDTYNMNNMNISYVKAVTPAIRKNAAMDILQNKLMSLNNVSLSKITTNAPKQYVKILDWLLSQKDNTTNAATEKVIIV